MSGKSKRRESAGSLSHFREQVGCSVKQAEKATNLGKMTIYNAIADGRIKSKLVGGRRILDVASVLALIAPDKSAGYTPSRRGGAGRTSLNRSREMTA